MERPVDAERIRAAQDDFFERVRSDPVLAALRGDETREAALKRANVFFRFALGGSALVSAETFLSSRPEHATPDDFARIVAHLLAALRSAHVDAVVIARAERELAAVLRSVAAQSS